MHSNLAITLFHLSSSVWKIQPKNLAPPADTRLGVILTRTIHYLMLYIASHSPGHPLDPLYMTDNEIRWWEPGLDNA
jgi:hypothetical protein